MAFKGILKKAERVRLRFQAALSNPNLTVVTVHWTPMAGQVVPADDLKVVVPGGIEALYDATPPATARFLTIDVDLPEPEGYGELELLYLGERVVGDFKGDQTWLFSLE
jgi:hypothetical protein